MNKRLNLILLLAITIQFVTAYEETADYQEENPDFEHMRSQYLNLQAAQKTINKKADAVPVYSAEKVRSSLSELRQDYSRVESWPTPSKKLGAISAVALDVYKNVVVFHRVDRIWNSESFDFTTNVYRQQNLGPITDNTVIMFDRETGNVINEWGKNLFYLPHGLHINGNYYYITDVALHQVFRFNIKNSTTKPELVLGEAFRPGKSAKLFCKPTSVASLENGDFFVADGYCNNRIVKFNFNGEKILEWGKTTFSGSAGHPIEPPNAFAIPHALTLVPDKKLVCVADRENGRVQCFSWIDGKFDSQYHSPVVGDRLFSVDYANGSFFVVNGPDSTPQVEIRGYTFDMAHGNVTSKFGEFVDPHDIAVTSDAKEVYVADLSPDRKGHRIHKFLLNGLKPTRTSGETSIPMSTLNVRRGDTALLVGSIMLLFVVLTIGIAILISRKQRRGGKLFKRKPWDKSTKNIFYDYNQFEKVPQYDDSENQYEQNENA